jgi:uncharacterized protein (TIGR02145 family)
MGYNDAQGDICPAGWRAPIGNTWEDRTRGDFSKLNIALGGASTDENLKSTEAMNRFVGFPFNLVTAGSTPTDVSDPEYYERNGALWTMSTYPGAMYYVLFDIYNVHLNMATTGQGYQIRCLTK